MSDSTSQTTSKNTALTAWTPVKKWLICDLLPFAACGTLAFLLCKLQDEVDFMGATHTVLHCVIVPFIILSSGLFFRGVIHAYIIEVACRARRAIREKNPSLSLEEQNEATYVSEIKKDIEAHKEALKGSSAPVTLFATLLGAYMSRNFWRRYFSVRPELVNEWTMKRLETMEGANINIFEKLDAYMDKLDFGKVGDFLTFKRFIISDLITWLWILASIGDVYAFFKYLKDVMEEGPFVVLLLLSLLVIRIVCEYTVVLFGIANLTREVRDELRISNAKKADENNCVES